MPYRKGKGSVGRRPEVGSVNEVLLRVGVNAIGLAVCSIDLSPARSAALREAGHFFIEMSGDLPQRKRKRK